MSKFWYGRAEFQASEQARYARYRLDPIGPDLRERAANYRDMGWRFVEQIGKLYALYRCTDPEASELYTDPESLGWAMKRLLRRQWIAAVLALVWAGWLLWDEIVLLFTAPAVLPMRLILNDGLILIYLFLLIAAGGYVFRVCRQTVQFTRLRRRLVKGDLPSVQRPTYPQLRENLFTLGMVALFLAAAVLLSRDSQSRRLSDESEWDFPHITLTEILPEGTELREHTPLELFRYDTYTSSRLAPEQYDVAQGALARLPSGESREVLLSLTYIKTRSPELAEWVYRGQVQEWKKEMEEYRENWEENTPYIHNHTPAFDFVEEEALSSPGLDRLTCFSYQFSDEDFPRACYVGQLGDQVFRMSLRGPELEKPLELLTERLSEAERFAKTA